MAVLKDEVHAAKMEFTLKDGSTSFPFPVNPKESISPGPKGMKRLLEHGEFDFAQGE